jgi:hypothetical protein
MLAEDVFPSTSFVKTDHRREENTMINYKELYKMNKVAARLCLVKCY